MVGPPGLEPGTKGLCFPLRLSPPLSGLWSGLYLPITGWPSSLYTFPLNCKAGLGSVLACLATQPSPTLTSSTLRQSKLSERQPNAPSHAPNRCLESPPKVLCSNQLSYRPNTFNFTASLLLRQTTIEVLLTDEIG